MKVKGNMPEVITLDFLLLANHVETVNGLLYISGGGWTDHHRARVPGGEAPMSHMGVAVSVTVPWTQTNTPHTVTVRLEDEDGAALAQVVGHINVGRPPQLPPGSSQPVMIGFPLDLRFPKTGGYTLIAELDGVDQARRWNFRVHDIPVPAPV